MTTTPPDVPTGSTEPPGPPGPPSAWVEPETVPSGGPRVTREEAKDLGRIRRSLTDRKIAGVAGGIARHFDVDPLLARVALVLLAIFGGGGLLVYAAGWLLIPEEGSDDGVIKVDHRTRTVLLAIAGAVAALSLLGDSFGGWEFPWPLAIVGLVIAAIAAAGRQKPHPGPLPSEGWIQPGTPAHRAPRPDRRTRATSRAPGRRSTPVVADRSSSGSPRASRWSASPSSPRSTWPGGTRRSRPIPLPSSPPAASCSWSARSTAGRAA